MRYLTVEAWYSEYAYICKKNNVEWLATGDAMDYKDAWREGTPPHDHFNNEVESARQEQQT